ncbi:methyl-accepting chemotaxis protein, partial [Vibrio rotiferianus]
MQALLKNLSVRMQVLLPVLATALAVMVALGIARNDLQAELEKSTQNSESVIHYKDLLATIDNQVYPLRISGIYAMYIPERRSAFVSELKSISKDIHQELNQIASNPAYRQQAMVMKDKVDAYIKHAHDVIDTVSRFEQGLLSNAEREAVITNYRRAGNDMVAVMNALSKRVNEVAAASMKQTEAESQRVQSNATMIVLSVFAFSLLCAWALSGKIVTPIVSLQRVMR